MADEEDKWYEIFRNRLLIMGFISLMVALAFALLTQLGIDNIVSNFFQVLGTAFIVGAIAEETIVRYQAGRTFKDLIKRYVPAPVVEYVTSFLEDEKWMIEEDTVITFYFERDNGDGDRPLKLTRTEACILVNCLGKGHNWTLSDGFYWGKKVVPEETPIKSITLKSPITGETYKDTKEWPIIKGGEFNGDGKVPKTGRTLYQELQDMAKKGEGSQPKVIDIHGFKVFLRPYRIEIEYKKELINGERVREDIVHRSREKLEGVYVFHTNHIKHKSVQVKIEPDKIRTELDFFIYGFDQESDSQIVREGEQNFKGPWLPHDGFVLRWKPKIS